MCSGEEFRASSLSPQSVVLTGSHPTAAPVRAPPLVVREVDGGDACASRVEIRSVVRALLWIGLTAIHTYSFRTLETL